jgi:hypothetical protein
MGRVINLHQPAQCTGACETAMGCECHPSAGRYPAPAAPDQPLQTMPGDLGEHHEPPSTRWTHPATMFALAAIVVALIASVINGIYASAP